MIIINYNKCSTTQYIIHMYINIKTDSKLNYGFWVVYMSFKFLFKCKFLDLKKNVKTSMNSKYNIFKYVSINSKNFSSTWFWVYKYTVKKLYSVNIIQLLKVFTHKVNVSKM